jgi:hypothetical protein
VLPVRALGCRLGIPYINVGRFYLGIDSISERMVELNPITKMLRMEKKIYKGAGMKPDKRKLSDAEKWSFEGALECTRRQHRYGKKFATHSKFPKGELH